MTIFDDDEDDARALERLRSLGLDHLAGKPNELMKELRRLIDDRKRFEEKEEAERKKRNAAPIQSPVITTPDRPAPGPIQKTSTLVVLTATPGTCATCRHANQGTVDIEEGLVFCWMEHKTKRFSQACDATMPLPRKSAQPTAEWTPYFFYEAYDGSNCTYGVSTDLRLLAEDADDELKRALDSDRAVIDYREKG